MTQYIDSRKGCRKGQIAGQVFIYLMAAILFVMVTLYGYKAISRLTAESKNIALIEFKQDLETRFRSVAPTRDVERAKFSAPTQIREVCFVDLHFIKIEDREEQGICKSPPTSNPEYRPLVCDAWKDNITNVILQPIADVEIKVGALEFDYPDKHYLCANVTQGRLELRLEGRGNKVKVSPIS